LHGSRAGEGEKDGMRIASNENRALPSKRGGEGVGVTSYGKSYALRK